MVLQKAAIVSSRVVASAVGIAMGLYWFIGNNRPVALALFTLFLLCLGIAFAVERLFDAS